jgi:transposase
LLFLVVEENYTIKEAAFYLRINYSTAKTIIQHHRKTGRIDKLEKEPNE